MEAVGHSRPRPAVPPAQAELPAQLASVATSRPVLGVRFATYSRAGRDAAPSCCAKSAPIILLLVPGYPQRPARGDYLRMYIGAVHL